MDSNNSKDLKNLKKEIKKMAAESEKLEKSQKITFETLFTPAFMRSYTNAESFKELLVAGGFSVENQEDLEAIPEEELDRYIQDVTTFSSWSEMQAVAGNEYVIKKLGF